MRQEATRDIGDVAAAFDALQQIVQLASAFLEFVDDFFAADGFFNNDVLKLKIRFSAKSV